LTLNLNHQTSKIHVQVGTNSVTGNGAYSPPEAGQSMPVPAILFEVLGKLETAIRGLYVCHGKQNEKPQPVSPPK
jgi:hypothetical protein